MTTLSGRYVSTFAKASHALPEGMHMSADYPFMLPRIVAFDGQKVTIEGRGGVTETFTIVKSRAGQESGQILQSSSFEELFDRKPQRFTMLPFKDEKTAAIGRSQAELQL